MQRAVVTAVLAAVSGMASVGPSEARAGLFSFASDTADQAWTFTGNGASIIHATGANDAITLLVDDHNGGLPRLEFSTRFTANFTLVHAGSLNLGDGTFSHNYLASGTFAFTDIATNVTILSTTFSNQLFAARGGQTTWFGAASLPADGVAGALAMTWGGANLPGYGLTPGTTGGQFAFGLDVINTSGAIPYAGQNPGVALGANSLPATGVPWFSEASFVGTNIPAPAGLGVLAGVGVLAFRRRR